MSENLRQIEILKGLDDHMLERIRSASKVCSYERGEMVIWAQEACEFVYFILQGQIEVYRLSAGGREQIYERLGAGECFNLVPAWMSRLMWPTRAH